MRFFSRSVALLVALAVPAGCGGAAVRGGTGGHGQGGNGGGSPGSSGTGGTGGGRAEGGAQGPGDAGASASGGAAAGGGSVGGAGTGGTDGGSSDAPVGSCPSATPPAAPLRRLTRFEYDNTVRDLFQDASRPAQALPADGVSNVAADMPLSADLVDGYHTLAHDFAIRATKDSTAAAAFAGCDPAAIGEDACRQAFIRGFVPKVFRRPLAADDETDMGLVFAEGRRLGGDFSSGVRAVIEVALQSPELLYRIELGEGVGAAQPTVGRPSSYEMATRLSYLLVGTTPDAQLLAAAASGKLTDKTEVEAQARRLLGDPRAHDVVRYFTLQLMRLLDVDVLARGGLDANAGFTRQIADSVLEETRLYIDEVTWQGAGDFRTLLTSPVSFLNGPLATFYGVPDVTGDTFTKVSLDPARRAGLLTQPSVLARTSNGGSSSPSNRALLVFQQILCGTIPSPPVDEQPPAASATLTTRQRYEMAAGAATCAPCHQNLDPLGFAFEHYDAVGRWRDAENGRPIDATGQIAMTDARGTFDGAVELGQRLAASADAQACYVGKWMAYAYGRVETPEDVCSRRVLADSFARSHGNVRELLVALTQTDAFLYRPLPQP